MKLKFLVRVEISTTSITSDKQHKTTRCSDTFWIKARTQRGAMKKAMRYFIKKLSSDWCKIAICPAQAEILQVKGDWEA